MNELQIDIQELSADEIDNVSGGWALAAWVADQVADFATGFVQGVKDVMKQVV